MIFTVWVTTACNMKCKYCYEGIEKKKDFMTIQTAEAVVEWILNEIKHSDRDYSLIRFHGGEPMLNFKALKRVVELLSAYDEHEFMYEMTTNAYSITEEQIKFLADNGFELSVSIDGKKDVHDSNRILADGSHTFDTVFKNALLIKKYVPRVNVRMTITSTNYTEYFENIKFLVDSGFKEIISAVDIFDQNWTVEKLDELELISKETQNYAVEKKLTDVNVYNPLETKLKRRRCEGGITGANIDPYGNLFPCTYTLQYEQFKFGNIFTGKDLDKLSEFQTLYDTPMPDCIGCGGYDSCTSVRCKFINFVASGDALTPIPVLCNIHNRNTSKYLSGFCQ